MKKFSVLFVLAMIAINVMAQEDEGTSANQIQTIFGRNKDTRIGWFLGTENVYTQFGSRNVYMSGLSAGIIINRELTIGFSGTGWTNRNGLYYNNILGNEGAYLEGGFGRVLLEYTLNPESPVHITFPVMIGAGAASYVSSHEEYDWEDNEWDDENEVLDTDCFVSFEPGSRAEVNVFRFMRLNAGVSYRYVGDLEILNTPSDRMNNLAATVGLKFGRF